jgi:NitT/TauT family transport system substrate-binding protein
MRALAVSLLLVAVAACGSDDDGGSAGGGASGDDTALPDGVSIASGSGLIYAPLTIMQQEGMLEERFPDIRFDWKTGLSGGAAVRDGILSGDINLGVSGVAPFLVGWDRGVDWKIIGAMGSLDVWMVTLDPAVESLEDITPDMSISAPSPDSGQAISLAAAAEKELGDPNRFTSQIVALPHPDAFQALTTGSTQIAYTSPPFQYQLVDEHGAHIVTSFYEVFENATSTALVMTQDYYDRYPAFAEGVHEALNEALEMLRDEPEQAAEILSAAEGGTPTAEEYAEWIQIESTDWTSQPYAYLATGEFMQSAGLISNAPESLEDFAFPTVEEGD